MASLCFDCPLVDCPGILAAIAPMMDGASFTESRSFLVLCYPSILHPAASGICLYIDYWFFGITTNFGDKLDEFMGGTDIEAAHRSVQFVGKSDQSIIVSFKPDQGECLHVIRPQDASFRKLEPLLKEASHLSALDHINSSADPSSPFLKEIGATYPEDWCTFYQKADLARQEENYEKVIELWQQAGEKNFSPGSYFEYFPFLESYIHLQQWENAEGLTREAIRQFPIAKSTMCDYWNALPAQKKMWRLAGSNQNWIVFPIKLVTNS